MYLFRSRTGRRGRFSHSVLRAGREACSRRDAGSSLEGGRDDDDENGGDVGEGHRQKQPVREGRDVDAAERQPERGDVEGQHVKRREHRGDGCRQL